MKTIYSKILLAAMLCAPGLVLTAQPQQPAPPVDFTPQTPPKAAVIIEGGNPTNVFAAAISSLTTNGFSVINSDRREFVLEVRKLKSAGSKDCDKVIVWLGRDAAKPDVLKVYILFGRYIEVFGRGGKLGRQILDKDDEDSITSSWRPQLIEALENTGE